MSLNYYSTIQDGYRKRKEGAIKKYCEQKGILLNLLEVICHLS